MRHGEHVEGGIELLGGQVAVLHVTVLENDGPERRGKPRLYEAFPVKVRGSDESGHAFEIEALPSGVR